MGGGRRNLICRKRWFSALLLEIEFDGIKTGIRVSTDHFYFLVSMCCTSLQVPVGPPNTIASLGFKDGPFV